MRRSPKRLAPPARRGQGRRRASSLDAHEAFIVGLIEERKDIGEINQRSLSIAKGINS
ncbi:hypothetical protein ACFSOZ_18895 [Mesorhizobium newzealandense]|uniref:Uncharacterized protein n=1 Tax=Mesorhizobium newzealandense TaxID=1300302 RepID=A0ABW4UE23_9HYPH